MQIHLRSFPRNCLGILVVWLACCSPVEARAWSDASGKFQVDADLFARNEETVVLQKKDHRLMTIEIAQLSAADQAYLGSQEAQAALDRSRGESQTWTMENGLQVQARVVDYAQKEISLQRRRGHLYVNDRRVSNLPEIYQRMLPKVVAHGAGEPIADMPALEKWVLRLKGQPYRFTVEGVLLEWENGDEYLVPFHFFSADDLRVLKPGWERWLAVQKDEDQQQEESLRLQAAAQNYQFDRARDEQVQRLELGLLAVNAGLVEIWVVDLVPGPSVAGVPRSVPVPARNSAMAAAAALANFPGYQVLTVRRLNPR